MIINNLVDQIAIVVTGIIYSREHQKGNSTSWSRFVLFLFLLMMLLIGLAILTALLSGKEAMGMGPVRAVREDW